MYPLGMKPAKFPGKFVARSDIRDRLGISRSYVAMIVRRDDFPAPVSYVMDGAQPVWRWDAVERWARECWSQFRHNGAETPA
jgi:hypothetical protein